MTCDVCQDRKRVRLPTMCEVEVTGDNDFSPDVLDPGWKEFDCPQCMPRVPYRRVRAMKVIAAYPADEVGKYQMPIERALAARFGEYLLREGMIKFTYSGTRDFGATADRVRITAHLGVVGHADVVKSGAVPEIATSTPLLPRRLTERERGKLRVKNERAVAWTPFPDTQLAGTEFDEPSDALASRFSGLEIPKP